MTMTDDRETLREAGTDLGAIVASLLRRVRELEERVKELERRKR